MFCMSFMSAIAAEGVHLSYNYDLTQKELKICLTGDTGKGNPAQYWVAQAMEEKGCEQIRILGDIGYPSGIESEFDTKNLNRVFFDPYSSLLKKKKANFFLTLGNHDYFGDEEAWFKISKKNKQVVIPSHYYFETWKDICIFTLDTTPFDNFLFGLRRKYQRSWLKKSYKNIKKWCHFSVGLAHHPFFSVGKHGNAEGALKEFLSDYIIGKVDLFITGHDHHLSDEGMLRNTQHLISGAGSDIRNTKSNRLHQMTGKPLFAASRYGFIELTFTRLSKKKIQANWKFHVIDPPQTGKPLTSTVMEKGKMVGQGIRY